MLADNVKVLIKLIVIFLVLLLVTIVFEIDQGIIVVAIPGGIAYLVLDDVKLDSHSQNVNFIDFYKTYILASLAISIYVYFKIILRLEFDSVIYYLYGAALIFLGIILCFAGAFYGQRHIGRLLRLFFKKY